MGSLGYSGSFAHNSIHLRTYLKVLITFLEISGLTIFIHSFIHSVYYLNSSYGVRYVLGTSDESYGKHDFYFLG